MEPLPKEKVRRGHACVSRSLACLPLVFLLSGCVTLDTLRLGQDHPPAGPVHRVGVTWQNQVYFTPDPARGGSPTPGLVGRLYLFGQEICHPIAGQGSVTVDLYDCTPAASGQQPALLEEWRIDKATLERLLQKDAFGWGYTLFLPWGTYRPDLRNIQLRLRYEPEGMPPLFAPISPVRLQESDQPLVQAAPSLPMPRPVEQTGRSQSFNLAREAATPGARR